MKVVKCTIEPICEYTTLTFEDRLPLTRWRRLKCNDATLTPVFSSANKDNEVTVRESVDITGANVDFIW